MMKVTDEAAAMRIVRSVCHETAQFRIMYYKKVRNGWWALYKQNVTDVKMIHFLFRIFYMAPSEQDLQTFEWHNFLDTHHDFPMRMHLDNWKDQMKCATMADIVRWFSKTERSRNGLRCQGRNPNMIFCLGCKTEDEKKFVGEVSLLPEPESASTNTVSLPLRRSASALLYPVTKSLESRYTQQLHPDTVSDVSKANKVKHFPTIVIGEHGLPIGQEPSPKRKVATIETPNFFQSQATREAHARRVKYERLLKAHEWTRIPDENKEVLVDMKIRERVALIDQIIRGWEQLNSRSDSFISWLYDDITEPLHTRRFLTFEHHHFTPSHTCIEDA